MSTNQDVDILRSPGSLIGPVRGQIAVAPGDVLTKPLRGFIVANAGDVAVLHTDGTVGLYPSCSPGIFNSVEAQQILISGTDSKGNTVTTTVTGTIRGLY